MIEFIYKIIHFEGSNDHKENVNKSFLFIWIFVSSIQFVLIYLVYLKISLHSKALEYIFLFISIFMSAIFYYLIKIRLLKTFFDRGIDKEYYDFGKGNGILKPALVVAAIGLIVLFGRILISLMQ